MTKTYNFKKNAANYTNIPVREDETTLVNIPFINKCKQNKVIDAAEAYNLWDVLNSKYLQADRIIFWENYIHDWELLQLLKMAEKEVLKSIHAIEAELERFDIQGPKRHRSVVKAATNDESIRDSTIATDYHFFLQEMIELMLRAIRSSITNDHIRNMFMSQLQNMLDYLDTFVKYMKVKSWLQTPPVYSHIPVKTKETIDAGEAYHIWDHTTVRYDNLHQTDIYYNFTTDVALKALLKTGLKMTLKKQIEDLENEIKRFGIPLPNRPAGVIVKPQETYMLKDEHIYRMVLTGQQGLASLHGQAYKQSCTNFRIRELFKKLLLTEIKYMDEMIKVGKLKGWVYPSPQYRLKSVR